MLNTFTLKVAVLFLIFLNWEVDDEKEKKKNVNTMNTTVDGGKEEDEAIQEFLFTLTSL